MESTIKSVKLNTKASRCVAAYLKISPEKIREYGEKSLLQEISKKAFKGISKEELITIADTHKIKHWDNNISTLKQCISEELANRETALVPIYFPSIQEIVDKKDALDAEKEHRQKEAERYIDGAFKTVDLNRKEAKCVASFIKISNTKIRESYRNELVEEITKKTIKGIGEEELLELVRINRLDPFDKKVATLRSCIIQDLAEKGKAIVPKNLPSIQELVEEKDALNMEKGRLEEERVLAINNTYKTIQLNIIEATCVASYLEISDSKIKQCDKEELLWEITKKSTNGVSREDLMTIADINKIHHYDDSVSILRLGIEQDLASRGMALVPSILPSTQEMVSKVEERAAEKQRVKEEKEAEKARLRDEAARAKQIAKDSAYLEKQRVKEQKAYEREQARLIRARQAQAKKDAKAVSKFVGGLFSGLGKGVGSMFKESKAQKAQRRWMKRSTNTFNTK